MKKNFKDFAGPARIKHPKILNYHFFTIVSSGLGWEHVSVTLRKIEGRKLKSVDRCPTWEEMCFIKGFFWDDEETVVQYHPPKSEWISNHPYCLHLWKPTGVDLPRPHKDQVGMSGEQYKNMKAEDFERYIKKGDLDLDKLMHREDIK
jgi:hypothetical protein